MKLIQVDMIWRSDRTYAEFRFPKITCFVRDTRTNKLIMHFWNNPDVHESFPGTPTAIVTRLWALGRQEVHVLGPEVATQLQQAAEGLGLPAEIILSKQQVIAPKLSKT